LKITILQGAFLPVPPLLGGAVEKMWFRLAHEFCALGHHVTYISKCHPNLLDEETVDGIHHIRVAGYSTPKSIVKLKFLDLLYSRRAIKKIPPDSDVVVTNTFWAPVLIGKFLKNRIYMDVARMPKGQMWLYRGVGRLRANSTPVARAIKAELPIHSHSLVSTIPNPLPFLADSTNQTKRNVILYCGRIHPEKGLDILVAAFSQMSSEWSLRLVGPWQIEMGGGGEEYLNRLRAASSTTNVEFVGPIFDEELLANEYRRAAIFCYPSVAEQGETFGLAPLEAMAFECVPVVSALECFQDFIVDKYNGLIFDHRCDNPILRLRNVLLSLIEDRDARESMARQAKSVTTTHSSENIAKQFLEDFEVVSSAAK